MAADTKRRTDRGRYPKRRQPPCTGNLTTGPPTADIAEGPPVDLAGRRWRHRTGTSRWRTSRLSSHRVDGPDDRRRQIGVLPFARAFGDCERNGAAMDQ